MKKILMTLAMATSFAASAASIATNNEIDRTQEVNYTCKIQIDGKEQNQNISAMYGIKDERVVVAQLKINGVVTPGMWRDDFVPMNRFISQDPAVRSTVWTTMPADAQNLGKVDGGKFAVAETNGAQYSTVLENCKVKR